MLDMITTTSCALAAKRCIGARWFLVLLSIGAVLLPIAWFIVIPFFINSQQMGSQYALMPTSTGAYFRWEIAMYFMILFLTIWIVAAVSMANDWVGGRRMLYIGAIIYTFLIVLGHALCAAQTNERRANESSFAVEFNDVYCSVRTFEVCVQGNECDILELAGRTNATTVLRDTENVTDAAFSIWTHCVNARKQNNKRLTSSNPNGGYSVAPNYRLLDDCSSSREIDAWCGCYQLQNATLPVAEHLALPSPFASNSHMLDQYTGEPLRRMLYTDALLGSAVGCMLLTAWLHKARESQCSSLRLRQW